MLLGGRGRIHNLYRHEQRCHLSQVLLPAEQDTRRDPIAARYLRQAGSRAPRLLDDRAFIDLAKRPPVALAGRRHDRAWEVVSHMTKAMTNAMTKGMT